MTVVEVEIDAQQLNDAGYHTEDDFRSMGWHPEFDCEPTDVEDLEDTIEDLKARLDDMAAAVGAMHTEFHGDQPLRICLKDPCRAIFLLALPEDIAS